MRVLMLGGTTEASALARALVGDVRFDVTVSLAGRTRAPVLPVLPSRIGGFGGIAGLVDYLRRERIEAVLDATHPFAAQMTRHAVVAAEITGIPLLRVDRPAWVVGPGDHWIEVGDMPAAARALGDVPRRVLLTIGQTELAPFCLASWHRYVIRSVDAPQPELVPAQAEVLTARGPFDVAFETALLLGYSIEMLVTKNSGGSATVAKLTAARALGLPVVMIRRPPSQKIAAVRDVAAALEWLAHQAALMPRGV